MTAFALGWSLTAFGFFCLTLLQCLLSKEEKSSPLSSASYLTAAMGMILTSGYRSAYQGRVASPLPHHLVFPLTVYSQCIQHCWIGFHHLDWCYSRV